MMVEYETTVNLIFGCGHLIFGCGVLCLLAGCFMPRRSPLVNARHAVKTQVRGGVSHATVIERRTAARPTNDCTAIMRASRVGHSRRGGDQTTQLAYLSSSSDGLTDGQSHPLKFSCESGSL
jgi:hypothetical protein